MQRRHTHAENCGGTTSKGHSMLMLPLREDPRALICANEAMALPQSKLSPLGQAAGVRPYRQYSQHEIRHRGQHKCSIRVAATQ